MRRPSPRGPCQTRSGKAECAAEPSMHLLASKTGDAYDSKSSISPDENSGVNRDLAPTAISIDTRTRFGCSSAPLNQSRIATLGANAAWPFRPTDSWEIGNTNCAARSSNSPKVAATAAAQQRKGSVGRGRESGNLSMPTWNQSVGARLLLSVPIGPYPPSFICHRPAFPTTRSLPLGSTMTMRSSSQPIACERWTNREYGSLLRLCWRSGSIRDLPQTAPRSGRGAAAAPRPP
ncbi:hypothetical protein SAMN04489860_1610 [Paraoerskovia marina]|uniref:Uncharacterized protein n=1 Tax=Paraoerskovia marina TaxID=545619 RepID=A0A1H1SF26_9CELL|nr:hypothetical protein SAMN04489860_1610 [Paraoerskovia marina]